MAGRSGKSRHLGVVIVLTIAFGVALLWPVIGGLGSGTSSAAADPVTVTAYDARYVVAPDGLLTATETITGEFPYGRHGIFRYWDVTDRADASVRYLPTIRSVTRDGVDEPYTTSWQSGHTFYVAKIGDPNVILDAGAHTYVITYTVPGTISPYRPATGAFAGSDGTATGVPASVFAWDVVARGWEMAIQKAHVTVTLPSTVPFAQCAVEGSAVGAPCTVSGAGTTSIDVTATSLPPRSGVYLRASLDTPAPAQVHVPWPVALDPLLGTSVIPLLVLLVIAALAAAIAALLGRTTLEDEPGLPIMYAPPPGLGPVQTVYLVRESIPDEALVATMLHLAERGVVTLTPTGPSTWQITSTGAPAQWAEIDAVSRSLADALGVTTPGAVFMADGSVPAGSGSARRQAQHRRNDVIVGTRCRTHQLGGRRTPDPARRAAERDRCRRLHRVGLPVDRRAAVRALRHRRCLLRPPPGSRHATDGTRSPGMVAGGRFRAAAHDAVGRGPLRLRRPQGPLAGLHPLRRGIRCRRRVGGEVPHRHAPGAADPALVPGLRS